MTEIDTGFINLVAGCLATAIAILGSLLIFLDRLGWLDITFAKKEKKTIMEPSKCTAHGDILARLDAIHDQQVHNIGLHNQHIKDLHAGKSEFKEVKTELKTIGEAVAVLLDRTGGRPKGLYDAKL